MGDGKALQVNDLVCFIQIIQNCEYLALTQENGRAFLINEDERNQILNLDKIPRIIIGSITNIEVIITFKIVV